jgi:hypothetical protein
VDIKADNFVNTSDDLKHKEREQSSPNVLHELISLYRQGYGHFIDNSQGCELYSL